MKKKLKILVLSSIISSGIITIPFVTNVYLKQYINKNKNFNEMQVQNAYFNNNNKRIVRSVWENIKFNKTNDWMTVLNNGDIYSLVGKDLWQIRHNDQTLHNIKHDGGPDYSNSSIMQAKDGTIYLSIQKGNSTGSAFATGLYTIKPNDWTKPTEVFLMPKESKDTFMGKTFQASDGQIFALAGDRIKVKKVGSGFVDITPPNFGVFDNTASINEINGKVYIGNRDGLWRVDGTFEDEKSKKLNLTLVNSDISLYNSHMQNINGEFYIVANPYHKDDKANDVKKNKLYIFNERQPNKLREVVTKFNGIGEFQRIKDGRFIIVAETGIYITRENELNSSSTFEKLFDDENEGEHSKFISSQKDDENVYMGNSKGLFKISEFKEPDSIIRWHKNTENISNNMIVNSIKIDTKLSQHASFLEYKNGKDWKIVPSNGIIQNLNDGTVEFKWVTDKWNTHLKFYEGDNSGNIYTKKQISLLRRNILSAPKNAKIGDKVTQANIDKRNKFTLAGRPVPIKTNNSLNNGQITLFKQDPFGLDDDENEDPNIFKIHDKNAKFSIPINKNLLTKGNYLDLKFKMAVIKTNTVHPTLKSLQNIYLYDAQGKAFKYEGYMRITFNEKTNNFKTEVIVENTIDPQFQKGSGVTTNEFNKSYLSIWREGLNSKQNKVKVKLHNTFLKSTTGIKDLITLNLFADPDDETGEDATYFEELKLISNNTNLTEAQIAARDADFAARKMDKIGHTYTKDEIWLRDTNVNLSPDSILGLNKKNNREIKALTKIELHPQKIVSSKAVMDTIAKFVSSKTPHDIFNKNYLNNELELSIAVLGLDPTKYEVFRAQKLHNGINHITLKVLGNQVFENGTHIQEFDINLKKWFFEFVEKPKYKTIIFHKLNESFSIDNKILDINSTKFLVDVSNNKAKWGLNKITLVTKEGYMFSNRERYLDININVFKNSPQDIEKTLEEIKKKVQIGFNNWSKQDKQKFRLMSEVAEFFNKGDDLYGRIKNFKTQGFNMINSIEDTRIISLFASGNRKGELELSFATFTTKTYKENELHNFKIIFQGKSNETIAQEMLKKDKSKLLQSLDNTTLTSKNQAFRLISDIVNTIVDADSLYLLLGKTPPTFENSYFSKVSATFISPGAWQVKLILTTKIPMSEDVKVTPHVEFTKGFLGGKLDKEINSIPINQVDLYQNQDVNSIKERLDFWDSKIHKIQNPSALVNIKDIHSLKKYLWIDLNMILQVSRINKVEAFIDSEDNLKIKTHVQTYRGSIPEVVISKTFKLSSDNSSSQSFSFSWIWIIVISASSLLIIGIIISIILLRRRRF